MLLEARKIWQKPRVGGFKEIGCKVLNLPLERLWSMVGGNNVLALNSLTQETTAINELPLRRFQNQIELA